MDVRIPVLEAEDQVPSKRLASKSYGIADDVFSDQMKICPAIICETAPCCFHRSRIRFL